LALVFDPWDLAFGIWFLVLGIWNLSPWYDSKPHIYFIYLYIAEGFREIRIYNFR